MQIRYSTPNQIGSIASRSTIGMNTGKVISIMLTWSTNRPRKISSSIIPARTARRGSCWPRIAETMPSVAPEKLRICENVVAPRMMNRIMPEIAMVPCSAFTIASMLSAR